MVKEVKTEVNQSDAKAIEVMPMLIATGLVTYEGEIPHSERLELSAWGVWQVRVRARGDGLCSRKTTKGTISGDKRLRSGLVYLKVSGKSRHRWEPVFSLYLFFYYVGY